MESQHDEQTLVEREKARDQIQKLSSRVKQMDSLEIVYKEQIEQAN